MIRLALLGCGDGTPDYSVAASRVQNGDFVAVADADRERADRTARGLDVQIVAESLDHLLAQHPGAFDAVVIHTENATHGP